MSNIKLSIITVSFNSEKTIARTVESVLENASCCDFEIEYIIIDGASRDRTIDIVKSVLVKKTDNLSITIVSEPDKGIYDAMNKGISLSKGDFVGIINSDDFYLPSVFCNIGEIISSDKAADILHSSIINRYSDGRSDYIREPKEISHIYEGMIINHPSVFIRNSVYEKIAFDLRYKYVADWCLLSSLYEKGYSFHKYDGPSCVFAMEGVSNIFLPKRHKEIISVYFKFYRKGSLPLLLLIKVIFGQFLSVILDIIKSKLPYFYKALKKIRN